MPVGIAVLGWRLGLGWLLGRRWILLTTQRAGESPRRTISEYRFYDGNFYVGPGDLGAEFAPPTRAMLQAHPGPLGVRSRGATERETSVLGAGVIVFEPTGEPVPPLVEPDLVWLWAAVPLAVAALGLVARRARR